jgi:hypothetical protein
VKNTQQKLKKNIHVIIVIKAAAQNVLLQILKTILQQNQHSDLMD